MIDLDLRGKDYLSATEAAHYCCVSPDHFAKHEAELRDMGIEALRVMGKKVYRRADLAQFIEKSPEWQRSASAKKAGISTGATPLPANVRGVLSGESQKKTRASRSSRSRLNSQPDQVAYLSLGPAGLRLETSPRST